MEGVMSSDELRALNQRRDEVRRIQTIGPDGLRYPILSLCCFYAESEGVHRSCTADLCACPCHDIKSSRRGKPKASSCSSSRKGSP